MFAPSATILDIEIIYTICECYSASCWRCGFPILLNSSTKNYNLYINPVRLERKSSSRQRRCRHYMDQTQLRNRLLIVLRCDIINLGIGEYDKYTYVWLKLRPFGGRQHGQSKYLVLEELRAFTGSINPLSLERCRYTYNTY